MDSPKTKKPHVNIGTIGHINTSPTTMTEAISKYLREKGQNVFEDCASSDTAVQAYSNYLEQAYNPEKNNKNTLNNQKRFYYSNKRNKKQK